MWPPSCGEAVNLESSGARSDHQRRRDPGDGPERPAARAVARSRGLEVHVIAPDSNRSATARSITTRSPLWVEEIPFDDGIDRLRHRRDARRLRALRRARPGRRAPRADRLGHQPRLQPRRRHHLLGHGRGGAGGDRARHPGDRDLAAVGRAGDGLPLGRASSTSRSPPPSRPSWCGASPRTRCRPTPCSTSTAPRASRAAIEVTHLGKRLYNDEMKLVDEDPDSGRGQVPDLRLRALLRGRGGLGPLGDRAGADLGHPGPLRPHRPRRASTG